MTKRNVVPWHVVWGDFGVPARSGPGGRSLWASRTCHLIRPTLGAGLPRCRSR